MHCVWAWIGIRWSYMCVVLFRFFFSSRRRHTRFDCDWSSDVCSSDLWKPDRFARQKKEMTMSTRMWTIRALLASAALMTALAQGQTLRFGLAEDPDILDPTLARTFVGRIVFAALCDKLVDIDENLNIVPQLATSYQWSPDNKALTLKLRQGVTFHDGEKFDAAAVKYNIERHKTMAGSNRRGELAPVSSVDVIDAATVRLNLTAPFSPLLAQLADRAGMMVSPKAAQAERDKLGGKPVQ